MLKKLIILLLFILSVGWSQNPVVNQFSNAFADVAEKVNPSVVTILAVKEMPKQSFYENHPFGQLFPEFFEDGGFQNRALGSGVIVDAGKGYILTNNHVVDQMTEITVKLIDKREFEAKIIGNDPKSDLAIIQIEANNLQAVNLGDSDKLRVGEWVLAIGSPFNENLSHTVTAGIISALGRSNIISGENYEDFIQTDTAINPGNSGGALVSLDGTLVGINTAIATGGFERSNRGVGFAIPVNMARKVMNDLIHEGRVIRAWLGVYIQDLDDATARAMDLNTRDGALIGDVVDNSPAEKGGIAVGDVITAFDGKKINDSAQLKNIVSSSKPEKQYAVDILRNGEKMKFNISLEELPENPSLLTKSRRQEQPEFGFSVENVNASLSKQFDIPSSVEGVVVTEVDRSSNAYKTGLRAGDVIIRVGKEKVKNTQSFYESLKNSSKGNTLLLLVKRGDATRFLTLDK